ncbi:hypothetical protein [Streptosporangium pseudovulgare]|uniref:hypothetical protein n=1 Tax=Streptosporangium pseudovulgare TaxID=35765 RepID=UPI00166FD20D|nr:hypothetical protein [Streptosporangium pseudovulgare]
MGPGRDVATCARVLGLCAAVFVLTGGAAAGDDVSVTPSTARPGQLVIVSVDPCVAPAVAYSAAFDTTSARLGDHDGAMYGTARVSFDTVPGSYVVTVRCVRGGPYNGTFTVGAPRPAGYSGGDPDREAEAASAVRTLWLFGALATVVTVLGTGLTLAIGRRARGDRETSPTQGDGPI